MAWLIVISFIALLAIVLVCIGLMEDWNYHNSPAVGWCALAGLILALLTAWTLGVFAYNRALQYNAGKCKAWGVSSGYQTKFVNIGYGDWNCWANVEGKWLPIKQVRAMGDQS